MRGTRPLDNHEIAEVYESFDGIFAIRNRSLFMLGVSTGGRISELLSLRLGDVFQNGAAVSDLLFHKSITKGAVSRAVPVNSDGREAIEALVGWHRSAYRRIARTRPLFPSRNGKGRKPLSRREAHDVLKRAYIKAGLNGHLATHSLRKSFAQRLYEQTSDIFAVQEMLGHAKVLTTQKYLGVNYASMREAVENMSLASSELHTIALLGSSLEKLDDNALFVELALRGYDLSELRSKVAPIAV